MAIPADYFRPRFRHPRTATGRKLPYYYANCFLEGSLSLSLSLSWSISRLASAKLSDPLYAVYPYLAPSRGSPGDLWSSLSELREGGGGA